MKTLIKNTQRQSKKVNKDESQIEKERIK